MNYQIGAHSALVSLGLEKHAEAVEGGPRNYIALSDILAGVAPFPVAALTGGLHGVASDRPFSGSIAGLGGAMTGNMVGAAAGEVLSATAAQQLRQLAGKRLSTRQANRLVEGLTTAGRRLGGVAGGTAGHYHATRHFGVHPSVRGDATPSWFDTEAPALQRQLDAEAASWGNPP